MFIVYVGGLQITWEHRTGFREPRARVWEGQEILLGEIWGKIVNFPPKMQFKGN